MPPRPLRPCKNPTCRQTSRNPSGFCDTCQPAAEQKAAEQVKVRDRARGTAAERGYDKNWRRLRDETMGAAQGLCADCRAKGLFVAATEVHHADGDSRNNEPKNRVALCRDCHDTRHGGVGRWRPSIKGKEAADVQR